MSEIISNFVEALNEELISERKRSTEESFNLQDGEKTSDASDKSIYTFFVEEDLKATRLKDDTPVTLVINDEEFNRSRIIDLRVPNKIITYD